VAALNRKRVYLGALAGGVVWSIWSLLINGLVLGARYEAAHAAGTLLRTPRYTVGGFLGFWFLLLFVLSAILSWLYAVARGPLGAGPKTALQLGIVIGFAAAVPLSWSLVNWVPVERFIPLWWMLDLWGGAVLASVVAGWLYKD